jgi:threonine/homoserine/homoserine lactone efflux protein
MLHGIYLNTKYYIKCVAALSLSPITAVFDVLRYLGAAYWAYLGYNLWRAGVPKGDTPSHAALPATPWRSAGSNDRQGLAVAASKPKGIGFAGLVAMVAASR